MIRLIDDVPDGVIGMEASGKVTADDYESVLIPAVEEAVASNGKTRVLFVLGADFERYEGEAALDDMKMGIHNWSDFERIAFVSDHGVYRSLVTGMAFLMPGQVKVFELGELESAKAWIAG